MQCCFIWVSVLQVRLNHENYNIQKEHIIKSYKQSIKKPQLRGFVYLLTLSSIPSNEV